MAVGDGALFEALGTCCAHEVRSFQVSERSIRDPDKESDFGKTKRDRGQHEMFSDIEDAADAEVVRAGRLHPERGEEAHPEGEEEDKELTDPEHGNGIAQ